MDAVDTCDILQMFNEILINADFTTYVCNLEHVTFSSFDICKAPWLWVSVLGAGEGELLVWALKVSLGDC